VARNDTKLILEAAQTIKYPVSSGLAKIDASDRALAVVLAYRAG
jgi:hypothetical protein